MLTTLLHFNQCYQSTFQGGKHFADKHAAKNGIGIEPQKLEDPELTLEDEFQYLHLNLPVLEVLAYAPIYNALLDKYVESLELGKNRLGLVQGEVSAKMEDPGLFTLPCRLGDSKPFDALADLGSCVNIIPLYLFKKLNIGLLEETDHIFGLADGTKSYPKDPETRLLVGRGFLATANAVIDCRMDKITVGEGITSTWMTFGGNTRDLGSFGEETDKITDLHQIHEEVLFTERGDGVACIKRRRRDLSNDGVRDLATASRRGRLKEDLESSTPTTTASDTSSEEPIRVTPGMVSHIDDIVQSVSIQDKPSSYVGAAGGSTPEPSKTKANFRSLYSENLCEGVNYSIPRKVVETVKIHDVPIQVFSEDGLSIIASQIGKPIMLDSYTSSMCIESWGRSSFSGCLIEINVGDVLKESLIVGVPLIEGSGFTIETINIEYEWKPPRCDIYGFQTVGKKKKKGKSKAYNGGQFGCNTPKLGRSGIWVGGGTS
ncbi:hypothetical protein Tco_1312466 [Tanacetum coccineum]